ncbi:TauD/TfdA family dioxygenase [Amantichitinum ursilacus]|uniref:Taurine catabolism dioxygenase TauD, TfdA family n=1 Tax=Amantichitinum ursilacus TaxID=857265 RepID=A0A0N0GNE8_9NEIS|nr:TauD/TfdA family dioxygenase [Amantichitinum ursilacus]KPC52724.1 Taurine catabolism dioxygenase TauD, TfdA family [Amantichitinum ursilacus]
MLAEARIQNPATDVAPERLQRYQAELAERGWTLVEPRDVADGVRSLLAHFGRVIPQLDGQETFEVTLKPGFGNLPYSQSKNGIGPHTEAPVYDPPPRYLVLHCHKQAQCGGGHTQLADGLAFFNALPAELQLWATRNPVRFTATAQPGQPAQQQIERPMLTHQDGQPLFRFSYNQFNYGDVNPSAADIANPLQHHTETPLHQIAAAGEAFFIAQAVPVLIPEGHVLIWDNWRLMHARSQYQDPARHLTRYWLA